MLDQVASEVFQVAHVESIGDAERHLARQPVRDVLLDLGMPESNGLEGFRKVQITAPHTAMVLFCDSQQDQLPFRLFIKAHKTISLKVRLNLAS